MERQSTSKLFRALIAVVAFFVLCTSAILFASCGTDPLTCEHDLDGSKVVAITQGNCGTTGTVTYECSKCGAEVTVTGTLATGNHTWVNDRCSVCGISKDAAEGLTLQQVKDDLTTVLNTISGKVDTTSSGVNELTQKIVAALKSSDSTIPSLYDKLAEIKSALDALDFDFNIGDIELVADSSNGSTLGEVLSSLYKQVNALYNNYAKGVSQESLYDLLVGGTGTSAHVHNWVLELKKGTTYSCTEPNTYVWGCAFCDETKPGDVIVKATGHATEFKHGLTDEEAGHYFAATCIAPARVEGYCANCKQYTGEWTEVGQPTYQHHYVKETVLEGSAEDTGSVCTSKGVTVYHCETCGGAYVANDSSSSSKDQHNYYFSAKDEASDKLPMTAWEKVQKFNETYPGDETFKGVTEATAEEALGKLTYDQEQKLSKALEKNLNIVYYSAPTCVDPALIVVECMECGVRYAYTFGQPDGHVFEVVEDDRDPSCTMDGVKKYYHCDKCGYYFFLTDSVELDDDGQVVAGTGAASLQYTRTYMMALNGKTVINDLGLEDEELEKAQQAAYDVATDAKAALGHDFVPVYINTEKCVTAQDYVLVCQRCFKNGEKSFDELVETKGTANADALFYREAEGKPYSLKNLPNSNTDPAALATLLNTNVVAHATADDTTDKTSDLSKEWAALDQEDKVSVFAWLAKHGYLVRDGKDDEVFGSISVGTVTGWYGTNGKLKETAKTEINGYLAALGETFDLKTLYNGYSASETGTSTAKTKVAGNVLLGPAQAKNDPAATAVVNAFELPVVGHKFNDKFELVVGNCVMYERHVYFCSECGQQTGTPAATTDTSGKVVVDPPYKSVTGDDDLVVAGYADKDSAPKGYKTDLDLSWDAVCALEDGDGSEQILWLIKYGYFNDYRDSAKADWSKVNPLLGMAGLMTEDAEGEPVPTAQGSEAMRVQQRFGVIAPSDGVNLTDFFTHSNVLLSDKIGVFEVTYTLIATAPYATKIELGHTFDVVTLIGEDQNCTDPGNYVYVCSACGLQSGATKSDLTYQSGKEAVKTGLKVVDSNKADFQSDEALFTAAIDPDNVGTEKGQYSKTDLQLEWEALTVMDKAGTTVDKAKTESAQLEWLLNHGYLNNVIDTYFTKDLEKLHTQKDYDDAKAAIYGTDGKLTATAKEAVFALAKELAKTAKYTVTGGTDGDITVYYTKSGNAVEDLEDACANKTIDFAATQIPQAGHLYTKGDGTPYDPENDPRCTDFADPVLTALYNNADASGKPQETGKVAKWNDTKKVWEDSGLTFNKSDLDSEFRAQADKYGILAACKRPNCPLHAKDTVTEGDDFTGGYIAAEAHLMSYEKFEAYPEGSKFAGTPSPKIEDANLLPNERTHYNMKTADEYVGGEYPVEIGGDPVKITATNKQDAMDADLLNLYTLQKIYNYQHIDKATLDAHTELEYLEVEPGVKEDGNHTQDWMPLTRSETTNVYNVPSCWVSLRCYWYHYPVAQADGTYQEGTKCDTKNADTPHTLPKKGLDWNYNDNEANCQQGNLCIVCGFEMTSKTGHNLTDVSTLTGNTLKYWKKLFKDNYTGSHFGLEIGSTITVDGAEKEIKTEEELWDEIEKRFCEPTCCDEGHTIYVCTGELGVYGKAGDEGVFNAVEETGGLVKDKYNHYIGKTNSNATYYVETVKPTDEHNFKTYYFAINEKEIKIANAYDDETWNNGFNQIVCLEGYQEVEICVNKHREVDDPAYEGEELCEYYKTPIVHEAPQHTYAPVKEYWTEGHRFKAADPDNNKNAELEHVCVICGVTIYGEYGSVTGDGEYNVQYVQATKEQIDAWNANGTPDPAYGGKEKFEAQLVRTDDVVKPTELPEDGAASGTQLFEEGVNVFKGETTVKTQSNKNPDYDPQHTSPSDKDYKGPEYWDTTYADIGGDVTVLVGKDGATKGKLTFELPEDSKSTKLSLDIYGNVSFVGDGEDPADFTVDFSKVSEINLEGSLNDANTITFKNVTVELGEKSLDNWMVGDATLTFDNVVVKSKGTPVKMNATSEDVAPTIVIKDSTFISEDNIGFANWLADAEVIATKSVFVGKNAGAFIRGGTATFTECTFVTAGEAGTTTPWGDATSINATGALVVGNSTDVEAYGNATVTLENCKFGTYTGTYSAEAELGACSNEKHAVNAFSSAKNETVVDFDAKSTINANGFVKENPGTGMNPAGEEVSTLTVNYTVPTAGDLGATKPEQATNAAKLVKSVATSGGNLELPGGIGDIAIADELNVPAGKELTLKVGAGSTLKPSADVIPAGKLTITGGDVNVGANKLAVTSDSAELTLDGVTVTGAKGNNSTLYVQAGTLNVIGSTIVSNDVGFMTNKKDTTSATVTMTNTTIISTDDVAVLINTLGTYTFQDCTFYGKQVGAWVRGNTDAESDKVTFEGCKFYTGNTVMSWIPGAKETTWNVGSRLPKTVLAALLVGNGNTSYGSVKAVEVKNYTKPVATVAATASPEVVKTAFGTATLGAGNKLTTGSAWGKAQPLVVALYGTQTVDVKLDKDAYTALGTGYKLTTKEVKAEEAITTAATLLLMNNAMASQAKVVWTDVVEEKPVETPVESEVVLAAGDGLAESAKAAITDVAEHGGTVEFPAAGEKATTVELASTLTVQSDTTLNLNGNTLKGNVSVEDGASLNLEGGTHEGVLWVGAEAEGEGSSLTLNGVTAKAEGKGKFGVSIVPKAGTKETIDTAITLNITDSRIQGDIGLVVNGLMDGAKINITNSAILGDNGCGLSVCGEAEVTAKNSVFFGSATAVQMASGKGTFTDCTFVSANDNFGTTSFGQNTNIPTATLGNFVINSRGGGYGDTVEVEFAGTATFITAKMESNKYKVGEVFDAANTTKKTALNWVSSDEEEHLIGYYTADETAAEKVTVTVVGTIPASAETATARVTLTSSVELSLKLGQNVFFYTDSSTQAETVDYAVAQKVVTGCNVADKTVTP